MPERWLEELQAKVANYWEWHSPALQISFRFTKPDRDDDFWEVWVYPAVQEIVGGKEDGETVWSGFNFDVLEFLTTSSRKLWASAPANTSIRPN